MLTEIIRLYEKRTDVTLTTYLINENGELSHQGNRPAVLICPGGGYMNCSDREAEPVALAFAAMGYHTFVLRYSTYNEGENLPPDITKPLPPKKRCQHPAPVHEIGQAMLIIHEHATQWYVDTARIAVCGFSAGAHNAAMYGIYWDKPMMTEYLNTEKEKIRPAALILGYTLSDYIYRNASFEQSFGGKIFESANIALLGSAHPDEKTCGSVSPARLVSANTPPTFLWATSEDELVPVQHSLRMAHALADHKIPFEIHIFEKGSHGLCLAAQATALSRAQICPDAAKWVSLAECWLQKRFALKLPEKSDFRKFLDSKGVD